MRGTAVAKVRADNSAGEEINHFIANAFYRYFAGA